MTTTNNDSQLRTFKLIDRKGFLYSSKSNSGLIETYLSGNNTFKGYIDCMGNLVHGNNRRLTLILDEECEFFREVMSKVTYQSPTAVPEQPESQLPYQHLIDDCKAVDGSLCIHKEGVVFLWEDSEYVIKSPKDYDNLISSIKVLQSLQKVYTIESLTDEGE